MVSLNGSGHKFESARCLLRTVALACLVLAVAVRAHGAGGEPSQTLPADSALATVDVGPYLEYLPDPGGALTIDDVLGGAEFAPLPGGAISFGYDSTVYWFRFRVRNLDPEKLHLYLEARYPLVDSIELFLVDARGRYRKMHAGDSLPYAARPLPNHLHVFPLHLDPGAAPEIYLRIHTTSSFDVPLFLSGEEPYMAHLHDLQWLIGAFYGVILGLLAYNAFLYLTTREPAFLYYVLYLAMTYGYMSAFDGIQFRMFPEAITWQKYSIYVCSNGSMVFLFLFAIHFLALSRRSSALLLNVARTAIGLNLLAIAAHLVVDISVSARLAAVVGLLSFICVLVLGVIRLREGYRSARIFVLAFVVFLVVATTALLGAFGVLPFYELSRWGTKVGILLQLILLSLALGDRINVLKEMRFKSRQEVIEAEAHSRATSEFLAKMSHEIRTPMNGVLGMADLMQDTRLDRIQKHYIDVISSSGRALLGVINDILDFSKIEAGKMELEQIDVNLEELLNECISVFSLKADEKDLEFVLRIDADAQLVQRADPTRLRQVILNLLGNAFKFTDTGHVMLHLRGDAEGWTRYEIEDSGIGIPAEVQARLFTSFTQADTSTTRKYGGTGLGLAICKQMVELMGGEIGIDSAPGEGSTFWFRLPTEPAEDPDLVSGYRRESLPSCRILLVSNRPCMNEMLAAELPQFAIEVDVVNSGSAAIARIHFARGDGVEYALVAFEKHLPDRSPYAVARDIGDLVDSGRTRFLLLTGLRENEEISHLQQAGFVMAANRPQSCAEFRDVLTLLFRPGAIEQDEGAREADEELPDYSDLRCLTVDDNQVNLMVIRGMLKKLGIEPEIAGNGVEAVAAVRDAPQPFDLILMDCEMPEMDGYTATRAIRDLEKERRQEPSLIVALSAHVMADARQRTLDAGMDDHMSKPVSMAVLKHKLAVHLKHKVDS